MTRRSPAPRRGSPCHSEFPIPRGGMRRNEKLGVAGIMGEVSRQAKTVRSLVHNSPSLSLVLVRRDVTNGGSVGAER